ncbi:aconitate hydratase [Escherichia coli]|nr:aconitate hydratase [Escherichia coli]
MKTITYLSDTGCLEIQGASLPGIKAALDNPGTTFKGYVIHEDAPVTEITLYMESLTAEEREIIKAGSLINFNKNRQM